MAKSNRKTGAYLVRKPTSSDTNAAASAVVPKAKIPDQQDVQSSEGPRQHFRFFDLPSELRLRIYEEILYVSQPVDLDPLNYRLISPRLTLFLVNHRMHEEAYRVFYSQPLRLFPNHGRFFHTRKPLLSRLSPRYRNALNKLELRLGPGWSAPPRCQNTDPSLGLADCSSLRTLKIFVECDPSESVFNGFRGKNATEETYKWFCVDILRGIIQQAPSLESVEIDAFPSVQKDAPLVLALMRTINQCQKLLIWGPLRGWDGASDEPGLLGIEKAMAGMAISSTAGLVSVQA